MASDESMWIGRAQDAEARNLTLSEQLAPLKEKVRSIKELLCARERSDGTVEIDFVKLADRLGLEGALELRKAIDERWKISGEAGEKPRIRVTA